MAQSILTLQLQVYRIMVIAFTYCETKKEKSYHTVAYFCLAN